MCAWGSGAERSCIDQSIISGIMIDTQSRMTRAIKIKMERIGHTAAQFYQRDRAKRVHGLMRESDPIR